MPHECVFCLQMDNQVVVSDYAQMDRVLREERQYILNIVKQIKKVGCTVLLIQKSILRFVLASVYCCLLMVSSSLYVSHMFVTRVLSSLVFRVVLL